MTAHLLRLHRTLWRRSLKDNTAGLAMSGLVALYALLGVAGFAALVWTLDPADRLWALTGVTALGVLGFMGVTAFMPSGEVHLRAGDFAALPVTARDLAPALAVATLLTTRGMIVLVTSLLWMIASVVLAGPLLIPALLLTVPLTLLLGEVVLSLGAGGGRVASDRMAVVSSVGIFAGIIGFNVLLNFGMETIPLERLGRYLGWTPVGAAPAALVNLAEGHVVAGIAQLLIVVVTAVLGGRLWFTTIRRRLDAPLDGAVRVTTREGRERLLLPGLRWSPATVVFSRALRYIRRDPRLLGAFLPAPVLAAFFLFQGWDGDRVMLYTGMVVLVLMSGAMASNDFGYDGPALWLDMTADVSTRTRLLARHVASLAPAAILAVLYGVAVVVSVENRTVALLIAGVSLGGLVSVSALALLLSTFNPFPTSKPGTSPWSDRSGFTGAAFLAAFASLLVGWWPVAPGAVMVAVGHGTGNGWLTGLGLLSSVLLPALVHVLCVRVCVRRIDTHMPEIYGKVGHWVNEN